MDIIDRLRTALADRYAIEHEIGAGGMATVYLAQDIKHDRKVAIKVLRPELAAVIGAERFLAEIRTTAALQHPHILPLFDSGSADSFLFYVMPFVEGETLRGMLTRERQLGVPESVRLIRDVADALDYAHRHGVIHRDIKPENILVHDGRPVVADFGIALAVSAAGKGRMTETGLSLGTPHYMSPEQATADRDISARSDVYSLACVLYEMLAGDPPHTGPSPQAILMRILTDTPRPVSEVRTTVPPHVGAALVKALEKLPADRFESAKAFGEALVTEGFTYSSSATTRVGARVPEAGVATRASGAGRRAMLAGWAVAVLALAVAAWGWMRPEAAARVTRLDLSLGEVTPAGGADVVISPDGNLIAIAGTLGAERAIFLRRLDGEPEFRKIAGTEGGLWPSFSPDNEWIVFRRPDENTLAKVSVNGGGLTTLVPSGAIDPYFPHWGTDDRVVFVTPSGSFIVSAAGGTPEPVPGLGGRLHFLLPDGSGVLHGGGTVSLFDFASDSSIVLVENGTHPSYVSTGHLLYVAEEGGLFAVPFDLARHRVTGPPVRVLERVASGINARGYSVSRSGTLIQHDGAGSGAGAGNNTLLVIADPTGASDTLPLPRARRLSPHFSPDGRMIAFEMIRSGSGETDIHTFDLVSGTNTQITFDGDNDRPIWSPDGKRILFDKEGSEANSEEDLFIKPADNSGPERSVSTLPGDQQPSQWVDDSTIMFHTFGGNAATQQGGDLFRLSLADSGKATSYLSAPWSESDVALSPDRSLAVFNSLEGGSRDVWMRTFPIPEGKWRISTGGGAFPRWSPDGRYVYFWRSGAPLDTLVRVRIDRTPAVVVRAAEVVATAPVAGISNWDLHPDGRRFIAALDELAPAAASASGPGASSRFLVVTDWFSELKRLTAPGRR